MELPFGTLDGNPSVDYKTWMDMQFRFLANTPSFRGLCGIQKFTVGYADDEAVRWTGRLFRHYCIEENTEPLTNDPYLLPHLVNTHFADGVRGWSVYAGEAQSVTTDCWPGSALVIGYSSIQGCFSSHHEGDTFLVMRRSAHGPNSITQTIANLQPGRLYSLRLITADRDDLSAPQIHAVSMGLEGVEVLAEKRFQQPFSNSVSPPWGGYGPGRPAWMSLHWLLFRATAPTATLCISDWASPSDPGGPIGQRLAANFVQPQPYLP